MDSIPSDDSDMASHEILLGLKDRKAKPTGRALATANHVGLTEEAVSIPASGELKGTATSKASGSGADSKKKRKYNRM
jgi:hypothetical protein